MLRPSLRGSAIIVIAALVGAMSLTSCRTDETTRGSLGGRALAGPTCPVEVQGSPCPPMAWVGTVRATSAEGEVHETATDADGRFHFELPPGSYQVLPVTDDPASSAVPRTVTVEAGGSVSLDLAIDTGIRAPTAT